MKYVALYPRVSTQEQANAGYSIEEQVERLQSYAHAMGWNNTKLYVDAGFSGGNMQRPALQELIKDINAGIIEKVVVYKLDRLSRSQKDTLNLIEDVFLKNNVDFISMSENFDTSTPFGRAMVGILAVFAQLEREQIKERMIMGREGRAKEGKFHGGGNPPVGYDYIDGELVINPAERLQVLEIYDRYLNGASINTIETELQKKGYEHKYGKYNRQTIKKILTNKLYAGYISFGGKWYEGTHEPIIDISTHEQAVALVNTRAEQYLESKRRNGGYKSLLGGLIFCGNCGARYFYSRRNRNGHITAYYNCHSRRKSVKCMIKDPTCKNPNYTESELDNIIINEIKKLALEPEKITCMNHASNNDSIEDKIAVLQNEIDKIDSQRMRLMELYSLGEYSISEIQSKSQPLKERKNKIAVEIESLRTSKTELCEQDAVKLVKSFSDALEQGNAEEIKMIVDSLIKKIVIEPNGDITIYWRFA